MSRDLILGRLRTTVRTWEDRTSSRFGRMARMAEYVIIPDALPVWTLIYSAQTWAGKWSDHNLIVSAVTRGPGRDLVMAIEEIEAAEDVTVQEIWSGGLLYQGAEPPVPSFGARWLSATNLISLSIPAA